MLVSLLILVVVAIVVYWIIDKFFPEPARMIALVIAGIIILIALLQIVGVVLPAKLL